MSHYIELPLSGLEEPLSEMEQYVQDTAHRFAVEVLRPAGATIDKMSAEESIAPESPLWGRTGKSCWAGAQCKGHGGDGATGARAHYADRLRRAGLG